MSLDLVLALYAVGASAVFVGTYALGHYHGRAYVSDRTFGPVAAGLVRIEAASDRLEELADEPVPYWPTTEWATSSGAAAMALRLAAWEAERSPMRGVPGAVNTATAWSRWLCARADALDTEDPMPHALDDRTFCEIGLGCEAGCSRCEP